MAVATEPRLVALPAGHPLGARPVVEFADLLDEPFLALPASSGPLRGFWLATDARDGRPAVVGAEVASTEETVEALTAGLGVCLIAAGNTAQVPATASSPDRCQACHQASSCWPGGTVTTSPCCGTCAAESPLRGSTPPAPPDTTRTSQPPVAIAALLRDGPSSVSRARHPVAPSSAHGQCGARTDV
jgi:hypothetical protein